MSGVGGILLTSRVQSGLANLGDGLQMEAIAAAVIGGTSLSGGKGNVLYTIVGACIIGVINNGMDLLRVNMYWQGYCQRRRDHAGRVPGYPEEQR